MERLVHAFAGWSCSWQSGWRPFPPSRGRPGAPAGRASAFHAGHGGFAMSRSVKRVLLSFLVGLVLLFGQFASPPGATGAVGSSKGRLLGPDGQGRPGVVLQLRKA